MTDFAILAPVPLEHLQTGQEISAQTGFVAFGSRKFELFRDVDARRNGTRVPVLIYPSHEDNPNIRYPVSWIGWYIGSEESNNGRHSWDMTHRPPSTLRNAGDNRGYWAVFWHVERLTQLPPEQRFLISRLGTVKGGLRKNRQQRSDLPRRGRPVGLSSPPARLPEAAQSPPLVPTSFRPTSTVS